MSTNASKNNKTETPTDPMAYPESRRDPATTGRTGVPPVPPGVPPGAGAVVPQASEKKYHGSTARKRPGQRHPAGRRAIQAGRLFSPLMPLPIHS